MKQQAHNYAKVLMHPLYVFINNICRYGNFNNIRILQRFPICEDYNSVYESFGISQEEIDFIEKN